MSETSRRQKPLQDLRRSAEAGTAGALQRHARRTQGADTRQPDGSNHGFQANAQHIIANQAKFDHWIEEAQKAAD